VPNPGLANPAVLFRTLGAASTLFFGHYEILFPLPCSSQARALFGDLLEAGTSDSAPPTEPAVLRLQFVGADPDTQVVGEEQLPGIVNYFLGDDPANWRTNVPTYGSIVYEHLYPGIDLLYNGSDGALKGTYVVAPGANPGDIRWRYEGASEVKLSAGELRIGAGEAGEYPLLVERRPVAWQTVAGKQMPVSVRYVIHRDGSIGFVLGKYDASQPLIIDPTLDYATYWGDSGCEGAYHIAVDSNNNVYITSATNSQNYPPPDPDCEANEYYDVFVTKLDPSQTGADQHIYTTYIGGSDFDAAMAIGVDAGGKAYVGGYTSSSNLPTTANAVQPAYRDGGYDGMVIQLGITGTIQYVSYLGGTAFEELFQVAVADNGLMYVTGFTDSPDFWTTTDAYTDTLQNRDAFVSVLDTSKSGGDSLVYSTLFGGTGYDEGYGIDVSDGIIYFAGTTTSTDLPTMNPTQTGYGGGIGYGDAFAAKLDPSQSGEDQLLFATYLGGSGMEACGWVAADDDENMYLVGATESTDFPTTTVSLPYGGGDYDAFLTKWETTVPSLTYSIFVGGSGDDGLRDVAVDHLGNAYVAGGTGSNDFPTVDPIQGDFKGGVAPDVYPWLGSGDALIAKFDATGAMTFGTYLGGTEFDGALGIDLGRDGRVYVALGTRSTSPDLGTINALQNANAGAYDGFVVSIGGLVVKHTVYLPLVVRASGGGVAKALPLPPKSVHWWRRGHYR